MSAGKIAVLLIAVVVVLASLSGMFRDRLGLTSQVPKSMTLPPEVVLPPLSALNDAQKEAIAKLAQTVCSEISEHRKDQLKSRVEIEGLLSRILAGFHMSSDMESGFRKGLRQAVLSQEGGIFAEAAGGKARFLRLADVRGQGGALVRILQKQGGVAYFYLMPLITGGPIRFVDLYVMATGTFTSENMRDVMIPMLSAEGADTGELTAAMSRIKTAKDSGNAKAVISACESLPPNLRNRPAMRMVYVQALMDSGDEAAYLKELQRIEREEPDSISTTFKLLDLYALKKNWQEAAASGLRVDKSIGGDAYLKALSATCLANAGQLDEAGNLFDEAEAMEPDLPEVVIFRLHLDRCRKDYPALVKKLDRLKETFSLLPAAFVEQQPDFEAFVQSDEYKQWKSRQ